jgi:hypothetical protein
MLNNRTNHQVLIHADEVIPDMFCSLYYLQFNKISLVSALLHELIAFDQHSAGPGGIFARRYVWHFGNCFFIVNENLSGLGHFPKPDQDKSLFSKGFYEIKIMHGQGGIYQAQCFGIALVVV